LQQWRPEIRLCASIEEVRQLVEELKNSLSPEIVFILDIDLGREREREGLDAIRELNVLRAAYSLPFYIAVLTSHSEFEADAAEAGADVFLVKESHTIDALELLARLESRAVDRMSAVARETQTQLAQREYKELRRRLTKLKEGKIEYLSESIASIRRGLSWPLLPPEDQMILSMLSGPLSRAERNGQIQPTVVDLAIEGIDLLRHERPEEQELIDWAARIKAVCSDALIPWLTGQDPSIIEDWEL
jgi:hypothetical protein